MKPKICVSGSAVNNCGPGAYKKAWEVGRAIAMQNGVLVTGATIGIPEWACRGAKQGNGVSIGISPAASKREHVRKYNLPLKNLDLIMYTGAGYSGRNLQLIRSSDAVIEICGRIGTLNEFTIAFEDKKPIGILLGTGGVIEEIPHLLAIAKRGKKNIVYDTDPDRLVKKIMKVIRDRDRIIAKEEKGRSKTRQFPPE